jgi:DNA polymerase-3 subunit epsilon
MNYLWLQARRWYLSHRPIGEPLRSMLRTQMPQRSARFEETEFVALDIETTGLNPATAQVISVGWVLIRKGRVALDTAESHLVRPSRGVGSSASVHGLTDTVVLEGEHWGDVLDQVVRVLEGRVLLVHHAGLDKLLLDRLSMLRYEARLYVPYVDTMALELRNQQRHHHIESRKSLRLAELRSHFGLPRYSAHDSLVDAIATAELLIAMVAHRKSTTLRDLLA